MEGNMDLENNKNDKLISLAPVDNLNESSTSYKVFSKYFQGVLDGDFFNVSVSGKYGSGKSSLVYSFFKNNKEKYGKYLKINFSNINSMLTENNDDDDVSKNIIDTNTNEILLSVINQVIYQIDSKYIPRTRFKIKKHRSFSFWVLNSLLPIFMTLMILFNYSNSFLEIILFTIILSLSLSFVITRFNFSKINFNFRNIETDIDLKTDDFFDKYIDEIVYIFEGFKIDHSIRNSKENKNSKKNKKIKKKFLLIEDMDRFNNADVFVKLRDLNIKLNNKSKTKWVFIYLNKDGLFENATERTKFFDVIIPVVPFMTNVNSSEKLLELFQGFVSIPNDLQYLIGSYVDDFRMLKSIVNEFKVMFDSIYFDRDISEEEKNSLLCLIAYKNIYPDRFDDLLDGKGSLKDIIDKFDNHINAKINQKKQKIIELNSEKETRMFIAEKEILILYAANNNLEYSESYYSEGIDDNKAQKIIDNSEEKLISVRGNRKKSYDELKNSQDYKNFLDERSLNTYEIETNKAYDSIKRYESMNMKDISIEIIPDKDRSKDYYYLLDSIKLGYINENYINIINYFYGYDVDIRAINDIYNNNDVIDFERDIKDPGKIFNSIKDFQLNRKALINKNLINYMILNNFGEDKLKEVFNSSKESGFPVLEKYVSHFDEHFERLNKIFPEYKFDLSASSQSDYVIEKLISLNAIKINDEGIECLGAWATRKSHSYILNVINDNSVSQDLKIAIVKPLDDFKLNSITSDEVYDYIVENRKFDKSFDSIKSYWDKYNKADKNLGILLDQITDLDFNDSNYDEMYVGIIKSNVVSDEKADKILNELSDQVILNIELTGDLSEGRKRIIEEKQNSLS